MLSELESLLKTYKISPKREHSDHIDNAPGKILSAIDSVSAGLKRRDKLETRPEFNVPEKILSAVDAISAETQRKPKRETVKDQNLASKVLSAVDSISASTERKAKTSTDRAPGKDVEQTLDQLGKVLAGGKKQTRN